MDIERFREYLSKEYLHELEKHIDKINNEIKAAILQTVKDRIYGIFNIREESK